MKKRLKHIKFRIPIPILREMHMDLRRPHAFAFERVGLLFTRSKVLSDKTILILATHYKPIDDNDYVEDHSVGAKINSGSIRKGMQEVFNHKGGCFHVHLHEHNGVPGPSGTDIKGIPGVVDSFSNISGDQVNGYVILSNDSFFASIRTVKGKPLVSPTMIAAVGYPMQFHVSHGGTEHDNRMFTRQSFLGPHSSMLFKHVQVGIVGYGGGGSHIGQQLAHLGIVNTVVFDSDRIEASNMNRLVGGWFTDIKRSLLKTAIAKRVIKKILPSSNVTGVNTRWQNNPELLQQCDIIVGCIDSYGERRQLEAECRRYLIPLIDIGMDVYKNETEGYTMPGQVILSTPGQACLHCFGFLNDKKLAAEAARYGAVGNNPQVIWPNGVLASTAVGIVVDLITGWSGQKDTPVYLSYDGNTGLIEKHIRHRFAPAQCCHYPISQAGPVTFQKI